MKLATRRVTQKQILYKTCVNRLLGNWISKDGNCPSSFISSLLLRLFLDIISSSLSIFYLLSPDPTSRLILSFMHGFFIRQIFLSYP